MILKIICSLFIISLYLFSISFINAQEPVGCPDSYCPKIKCRELSCKGSDQKLLANSSKCGCCDQCIKILGKLKLKCWTHCWQRILCLDENEECLVHKQGSVPETECGEHLVCLFDNKKAKSFCRPSKPIALKPSKLNKTLKSKHCTIIDYSDYRLWAKTSYCDRIDERVDNRSTHTDLHRYRPVCSKAVQKRNLVGLIYN